MTIVNLRDYYPFYQKDMFIEVSDEIALAMQQWKREEMAYRRKRYWHHAYFSLDCDDGIERYALVVSDTPDDLYMKKYTLDQLHSELLRLPKKQAERIYSHYILGISKADIARKEKVSKSTIGESISLGLKKLRAKLK
jgi:DNA-directed RNA polymerase specialized sigma subunit, sigma24 homolog